MLQKVISKCSFWALPAAAGRVFRFNLLFFKEKNKRIFTSTPNAANWL